MSADGRTTGRSTPGDAQDLRCSCGNLMARITSAGVELKCRRCKRIVLVALPKKSATDNDEP